MLEATFSVLLFLIQKEINGLESLVSTLRSRGRSSSSTYTLSQSVATAGGSSRITLNPGEASTTLGIVLITIATVPISP